METCKTCGGTGQSGLYFKDELKNIIFEPCESCTPPTPQTSGEGKVDRPHAGSMPNVPCSPDAKMDCWCKAPVAEGEWTEEFDRLFGDGWFIQGEDSIKRGQVVGTPDVIKSFIRSQIKSARKEMLREAIEKVRSLSCGDGDGQWTAGWYLARHEALDALRELEEKV